ncbi:hypothetical protein BO94DRAFT_41988 [Aspergillus sclerotioniger CBS 115572]|uniref:Uncharacterized protein n=1 Tax=Aspergillus sclerotioniger CBS 115572 TaxID=1450535 RepID=A0A317WWN4_9EURO|nr:hypothetical protein BO94DRAFT_41988 [Aspergillus sclerotioniger CBS 115572]PWY89597.1 hypothetical protein BO94DRAFT_41988 [Aspergillus sclerotioniger CBS 115572]
MPMRIHCNSEEKQVTQDQVILILEIDWVLSRKTTDGSRSNTRSCKASFRPPSTGLQYHSEQSRQSHHLPAASLVSLAHDGSRRLLGNIPGATPKSHLPVHGYSRLNPGHWMKERSCASWMGKLSLSGKVCMSHMAAGFYARLFRINTVSVTAKRYFLQHTHLAFACKS